MFYLLNAHERHLYNVEHINIRCTCKKEFAKSDTLLDHVYKKHNICVS
ncbi:hypothetical protein [Acidianus hospitalis]